MSNKLLYKIHGWLGLVFGLFLFVVCFSGTVATLSSEADWLLNKDMRAPAENGEIQWQKMHENIQEAFPDGRNFGLYKQSFAGSADYFAAEAYVSLPNGQNRKVYLDPHSGRIQGHTSFFNVQRFFRTFHRRLFDGNRGIFLVTLSSFFLLFSAVTGFLFYKGWLKNLFTLRFGKSLKRLFSDAHKLAGVWSLLFGLLIALTGVFYFTELMINNSGKSEVLLPEGPPVITESSLLQLDQPLNFASVEQVIENAKSAFPELDIRSLRFPQTLTGYYYIDGQDGNPITRDRANKIYLHPVTAEVVHIQKASQLNTAEFITDIADPLHFGNFLGLPTKILWFIFGLVLSFSVLSGTYIWYLRSGKRKGGVQHKKLVVSSVLITLFYLSWTSYTTVSGIKSYGPGQQEKMIVSDTLSVNSNEVFIEGYEVKTSSGTHSVLEVKAPGWDASEIARVELVSGRENPEPLELNRTGYAEKNRFRVKDPAIEEASRLLITNLSGEEVVSQKMGPDFIRMNGINREVAFSTVYPKVDMGVWLFISLFGILLISIITYWTYLVLKV